MEGISSLRISAPTSDRPARAMDESPLDILNLPRDVIGQVTKHLNIKDHEQLLTVSKPMREAVANPELSRKRAEVKSAVSRRTKDAHAAVKSAQSRQWDGLVPFLFTTLPIITRLPEQRQIEVYSRLFHRHLQLQRNVFWARDFDTERQRDTYCDKLDSLLRSERRMQEFPTMVKRWENHELESLEPRLTTGTLGAHFIAIHDAHQLSSGKEHFVINPKALED